MITITDNLVQRAKTIADTTPVCSPGYRLKIYLIEADKGVDAEQAPTLSKMGFIAKSDNQKSREDRGTDRAIVVDIGPVAFTGEQTGNKPWVKVGQVIRILRYSGHQFEEPPGSGKRYGLINDEDVLGVYDQNVLEEVTNG